MYSCAETNTNVTYSTKMMLVSHILTCVYQSIVFFTIMRITGIFEMTLRVEPRVQSRYRTLPLPRELTSTAGS